MGRIARLPEASGELLEIHRLIGCRYPVTFIQNDPLAPTAHISDPFPPMPISAIVSRRGSSHTPCGFISGFR
jgi:hypothetical protein